LDFQHPWFLLLIAIIPLLLIYYKKYGKNQEGTIIFSSERYFSKKIKSRGRLRHRLLIILELCILFFLVTALARPRKVDKVSEKKINVIDIILVLDISSSMLADDFLPNRLEVVKNTAKEFISSRNGDRIGVVVFAGQSFIQCPLTIDIEVLKTLVDEISVADREYDGTAIGMAIANATNRLRDSESKSKIMILLSDGSNNTGEIDPATAAIIANNFNIKIYTIAAGTDQSFSRIPGRGLIRNEIDVETLKEIAFKTGGKFFRATDKDALMDIYKEIDKLERSEIEVKDYTKYKELYAVFLIPSIVFMFYLIILKKYLFKVRV
tara:strand:+ start:3236 stop:4204 length:969 start_codon:yes stop_codon:yes gene_type:complete